MVPDAIRFYAGAPLVTSNGHRVGMLCAPGPCPLLFDYITFVNYAFHRTLFKVLSIVDPPIALDCFWLAVWRVLMS